MPLFKRNRCDHASIPCCGFVGARTVKEGRGVPAEIAGSRASTWGTRRARIFPAPWRIASEVLDTSDIFRRN
jgi:hypothetical protein